MKTNKIKEIIKREANKVNVKSFNNDLLNNVSDDKSTYYFNNKKSIKPFVIIQSFLVAIVLVILLIFGIKKVNNDNPNKETSLELLSFELKDENTNNLKKAKPEEVELDYSDRLFVVATVKNLNRYSFIDLVVFRSDLNTMVVYNEGNGKYQCQSETKYQDGMWVTIIEFELIFETIPDNGYVSVDSINFLSVDNKQYKAGLSYAKSKEIRYTFIKGENYTLNENLFDETNNINLENIKSGIIYFNDDVKELNIDDINLDNVRFNNLQFVFNDSMNPFNIPVSYYKKLVNVYEEDGVLYLPSKTNKYYAVIDVIEPNKYINENSKYVSYEIFDKDNVNKYYYDNISKSYYLRSNNNDKFMLVKAGDGIINLDEIDILAYGISIKNVVISNNTDINKYNFESNNVNLSLSSLYVDSLDNLTNSNNIYIYDGFNENSVLYVSDDSGSVSYNNKKYEAINELDINDINDFMLLIHLKQIKNININCDLYSLPTLLFGITNVESIIINYPIDVIKESTFYGLRYLKHVELPEGVITIEKYAFMDSSLESIILKEGLETIESDALSAFINNITIPNSIKSIGDRNYLESFDSNAYYVENGYYYLGNDTNKYVCLAKISNDLESFVMNENTKVIYSLDPSNLKSIVIGYPVDKIPSISNCNKLTSVSIADGCKELGGFKDCPNLKELNIPNSVIKIGYLSGCGFESIKVSNNLTSFIGTNIFGGYVDDVEEGTSNVFTKYNGAYYVSSNDNPYYMMVGCYEGDIVVHNDTKVIICGYKNAYSNLGSITIPEGVNVLGNRVFYSTNIESITIPSTITKIPSNAFSNNKNLKTVVLPNTLTDINSQAFNGCENLENINIPNSLIYIGSYAFSGCPKLQFNEYNNGYYLGNETNPYMIFVKCDENEEVVLNENTKLFCFDIYNCKPKSLVINEGIVEINSGLDASYLESISIPCTVKKITYLLRESNSFDLVIPETVEYVSFRAINNVNLLNSITVPINSTFLNRLGLDMDYLKYEIIGNSIKIYFNN